MGRYYVVMFALLISHSAVGQNLSTGLRLEGGTSDSCPVLVTGVGKGSPAEQAGIQVGDVVLAMDEIRVTRLSEVPQFPDSKTEVGIQWMRGEKSYSATVRRENSSKILEPYHMKEIKTDMGTGLVVPMDATETEMSDKEKEITDDRFVDTIFPGHFPANEKLYYPGFEVLILKNPSQVVVLGIEDGPASLAGVHWGDTILSVNGIDPRNKSVPELEKIFRSKKPVTMTLRIKRGDTTKSYVFELEQTAQVLRDNHRQLFRGHTVAVGIPDKYLPCLVPR
jgi:C-terminal processing protease CtpA/Prc